MNDLTKAQVFALRRARAVNVSIADKTYRSLEQRGLVELSTPPNGAIKRAWVLTLSGHAALARADRAAARRQGAAA